MVKEKGIDTPTVGGTVRQCAMLAVAHLFFVGGCSGLGKRSENLTEIQLRQQRTENIELRRELESAQVALAETKQKLAISRQAQADTGTAVTLTSGTLGTVERLELNSLLSGGLNRDGVPGDELLSVLVTPVDRSGAAVQVDGTLTIAAFDYSLPDEDQKVGHWEWDAEETAALWSDGLVGTGYRLTREWQLQPRSSKIVLHARFVAIDGQQFDATQTVTIDVPVSKEADR